MCAFRDFARLDLIESVITLACSVESVHEMHFGQVQLVMGFRLELEEVRFQSSGKFRACVWRLRILAEL